MKRSVYILMITAIMILAVSCAENSVDKPGAIEPPLVIANSFEKLYPNATNTEWRVIDGYYVITFDNENLPSKAWLSFKGDYYMLASYASDDIPSAIVNSIKDGYYSGWDVSRCYRLTQLEMGIRFVVKVDKDKQYVNLFYTEYGELIKDEPTNKEDWDGLVPIIIPESLITYTNEYYPSAQIMDLSESNNVYTVILLKDKSLETIKVSSINLQ